MVAAVSKQPLKVYLCDLTHDTIVLVSDTIPINIGFVGSYAKKLFGDEIDIKLFKYPRSVIQAIKEDPPDLIGLSNYSWNSNLSEHVAGIAKKINPNAVTVQGGTNFPHKEEHQLPFMRMRPNTDFFIELEGEVSFSNLVGSLLAKRDGVANGLDEAISGCVTIRADSILKGERPERIKTLDDIPSPYLNGMLDLFFDGKLTPFLETNRGCPFACSFCHTGNNYFNKINHFAIERIVEEIHYIGPYMKKHGIKNLHIADTNFGMYARDKDICEVLKDAQSRYQWPVQIIATTGKNKKEQVIEITQILGNTFSVNMSVQSMDPTVLKNIQRDNIKLSHYVEINKSLTERGRSTKGEVIIGLPGETRESFVRGIEQMLDAGVSLICSYSLMLLHGTMFQDPDYRAQFGIKGKYRIVPLDFGDYDGEKVFDYEEVGVENKDMSFEDYLWIRGLALMVEVLHNSRPFNELFRYATTFGVKIFDFILRVYAKIEKAPTGVQKIFKGFMDETKGELWDSAEELIEHYRKEENYQKLYRGEVGGNVIYKYKAMSLAFATEDWIDFLSEVCKDIAKENLEGGSQKLQKAFLEIDILNAFVKNKLAGVLNIHGDTTPRTMLTPIDLLLWLRAPEGVALSEFAHEKPLRYDFEYTDEQLAVREDQFKRYGTGANALSKIVTRVSNVESLFRKIRSSEGALAGQDIEQDQFVRYMLAN